jgi:hypothetical protein
MVDVLNSSDHTASGFSLVKATVQELQTRQSSSWIHERLFPPVQEASIHGTRFEGHLMIFLASRSISRDNGPRLSYNDPMPRIRSALTDKT